MPKNITTETTVPPIPEDIMPECWKDETRMNVLFAPLRNRSVNPQDWDSKISFWKNVISSYCVHCKVYTFKLPELGKVFNRNGRSPHCLAIVIEEMLRNRDLKTIEEHLQRPDVSWSSWAAGILIKRPLFWSYNKLKYSMVSAGTDNDVTYVHLAAVQKESENLLARVPEKYKNKILNLQELIEITGPDESKLEDTKLLLHHLMAQGKLDMKQMNSKVKEDAPLHSLLIKFGDIKKVKPISDVDMGIHNLEQNERTLIKNLEHLENEASGYIVEAKSYLVKGHRQMAKSVLRKKREVDKRITKRAVALENVQVLLSRLRDADTDAQVLESYKLALSTLRTTFKEAGLSEESVTDTMVDLGEVMDIHTDIQSSLSQQISSASDTDLEEELAELMAAEGPSPKALPLDKSDTDELEEELKNLKLKFPSVPESSPDIKAKISV